MERVFIVASLLLCSTLRASARCFELPVETREPVVLDFWPSLNASCEMKYLQENLCCLASTFKDRSEAHNLLLDLLKHVPDPKYDAQGVAQFLLRGSRKDLEVRARYMCEVKAHVQEGNEISELGCHKCLEAIAHDVASGLPQNVGRCENSWAIRFGYVYEPDIPWEEDTTWCHLDYWFKVLSSDLSTTF